MAKLQRRPSQTNEYFTCEICMNPMSEEKRFRNQKKRCTHPLCVDCISDYIEVMVERKKMGQIRCPDLYCDNLLDPLSCSPPILSKNVFEKWCDLLCELEVLQSPWAYCPSKDCSELILDECGGRSGRKSSCPKCKTLFCFNDRRVRDRNDFLLTELAERNKWTKCPGCNCFVERIDGCPIIHCRCGIHFCHDCGEQSRWHWCGCKYEKIDYFERILMYLFTLLLIVCCYIILIWSKRYDALYETLP